MERTDEFYMDLAIKAAEEAAAHGEIPIGACVVDGDGEVLAVARNSPIELSDPTAHAEIIAMRAAGAKLGNYRLTGCSVYTTIEPCAMCAGALVNARIGRLIFGAADERFGAVRSVYAICDEGYLNHKIEIEQGVLEERCSALMSGFFEQLRARKRAENA